MPLAISVGVPMRPMGLLKASESPIRSELPASIRVSMAPVVWIGGLRRSRLCREIPVFGRLRVLCGILDGLKA